MNIFLQVGDLTGFSLFLSSMALLAATVFFILERGSVHGKWKLSLTVATLVTGIGALHYHYLKHVWLLSSASPVEMRYIDLLLTVPLMGIAIYLILRVVGNGSKIILYKLFGFSTAMLLFGYLGETLLLDPMVAFGLGLIFWGLLLTLYSQRRHQIKSH